MFLLEQGNRITFSVGKSKGVYDTSYNFKCSDRGTQAAAKCSALNTLFSYILIECRKIKYQETFLEPRGFQNKVVPDPASKLQEQQSSTLLPNHRGTSQATDVAYGKGTTVSTDGQELPLARTDEPYTVDLSIIEQTAALASAMSEFEAVYQTINSEYEQLSKEIAVESEPLSNEDRALELFLSREQVKDDDFSDISAEDTVLIVRAVIRRRPSMLPKIQQAFEESNRRLSQK